MSDPLWNLFKITLKITFKNNPTEAIEMVDEFLNNYIEHQPFENRLQLIRNLKELIDGIK